MLSGSVTDRCSSYILCTSPRSGSTLLCRMLEATGQCGAPDSHFHETCVAAWLKDHGVSVPDHASPLERLRTAFDAAVASGRAGTDMFALRLQRHSFEFFSGQLGLLHPGYSGDLARIGAAFGPTRFVYLWRESKLDQAISYLKARQSGLWHVAPDGREIERLSAPGALVYDPAAIAAQIAEFEKFEQDWHEWFAREGITPLCIGYEQLARDPLGTLGQVLSFLGVEPDIASRIELPVARLSDGINRYWAARYRAEQGQGTPG